VVRSLEQQSRGRGEHERNHAVHRFVGTAGVLGYRAAGQFGAAAATARSRSRTDSAIEGDGRAKNGEDGNGRKAKLELVKVNARIRT